MIRMYYWFCTLVWGLNFIAVKIQGDLVAPELSLFYRLALTCLMFGGLLLWRRPDKPLGGGRKVTVLLFGVCNFALSYLCLYYGTLQSSAAVVTMIFSLKVVFTPLALAIVGRESVSGRIALGGAMGIGAVIVLLYPTLVHHPESLSVSGLGLALVGTIITSIGDVCSAINADRGVDPVYANALGFLVAGVVMGGIVWGKGVPVSLPPSIHYWSALLYLSVCASLFAWLFYLKLVKEIGGARSGYMVALFPAIGGVASVVIGESDLTPYLMIGCSLSCVGAFVALKGKQMKEEQTWLST